MTIESLTDTQPLPYEQLRGRLCASPPFKPPSPALFEVLKLLEEGKRPQGEALLRRGKMTPEQRKKELHLRHIVTQLREARATIDILPPPGLADWLVMNLNRTHRR